jgi:hypothetical protein
VTSDSVAPVRPAQGARAQHEPAAGGLRLVRIVEGRPLRAEHLAVAPVGVQHLAAFRVLHVDRVLEAVHGGREARVGAPQPEQRHEEQQQGHGRYRSQRQFEHLHELTRVSPNCCAGSASLASRAGEGTGEMAQDDKLQRIAAGFAVLLATVTEMVRAGRAPITLLDAYDDASDQIIAGLRGNGIPDEHVQSIHKALARLRLALEEKK